MFRRQSGNVRWRGNSMTTAWQQSVLCSLSSINLPLECRLRLLKWQPTNSTLSPSPLDCIWMRNVAYSRWMICVNTNCLLINHHRGHLHIICSSLNVSGCVSLFVYLSTEMTSLSGGRGHVWDRLHKDKQQEYRRWQKKGPKRRGNENEEWSKWVWERKHALYTHE